MLAENTFVNLFNRDNAVSCSNGQAQWLLVLGWASVIWYIAVTLVCIVGFVQL